MSVPAMTDSAMGVPARFDAFRIHGKGDLFAVLVVHEFRGGTGTLVGHHAAFAEADFGGKSVVGFEFLRHDQWL